MGYVGMPLSVAFAEKGIDVIGFDLNEEKIREYKSGIDPTREVGDEVIKKTRVDFTSDDSTLREAGVFIVTVPTPVNPDFTPDLEPLIKASRIVGGNLSNGALVIYESTVYPGCTERVCVPVLEKASGLKSGVNFKIGYSPERINPGDKVHRLNNIRKIVAGCDEETTAGIKALYDLIIETGTFPVSNIKTAEAVKVVENCQRDVNIGFINEIAKILNIMDIDTNEVIDGMNTKWNALGFRPGLVGGHCIGIDPYYLINEAERLTYQPQLLTAARSLNESMGKYIVEETVRKMIEAGQAPVKSKVVILGITFKENCPDTRNSKVLDIIKALKRYGIDPVVIDPWADRDETRKKYNVTLGTMEDARGADTIIAAVAHSSFKALGLNEIISLFNDRKDYRKVLIDVKGLYSVRELKTSGLMWWRL